jgi:hypothetical protein
MTFAHYMPDSLRKIGTDWRGRCPYCDSSDGFSITPDEGHAGAFHCFSCHETGTAVWHLQEQFGASFPDACAACGTTPDAVTSSEITRSAKREQAKTRAERKSEITQRLARLDRLKRRMTPFQRLRWRLAGRVAFRAQTQAQRDYCIRLMESIEDDVSPTSKPTD